MIALFTILLDLSGILPPWLESILEKSLSLGILAIVAYLMYKSILNQQQANAKESDERRKAEAAEKENNRLFYRELRAEDRKDNSEEKEELLATVSKQEVEKQNLQKTFEQSMERMISSQTLTFKTITEAQTHQLNSVLASFANTEARQYEMLEKKDKELERKDKEIIDAYKAMEEVHKMNLLSAENLKKIMEQLMLNQAQNIGKIIEAFNQKMEHLERDLKLKITERK